MPRLLVYIIYLSSYACVLVLSLSLVLFIGLTRTDYGRDQLRMELERQIANRYGARLHIGSIDGNLRHQILAGDIRLYSRNNSMLVRADSIVATPHWRSIFSRRLSFSSLMFLHPEVNIRVDSSGRIALPSHPSGVRSDEMAGWTARNMELTVSGGVLRDQRANTLVEGLDIRAVIDRSDNNYAISVLSSAAYAPGFPVTVDSLLGDLSFAEGNLDIRDLRITSDIGNMDLSGSLSGSTKLNSITMDVKVELRDIAPSALNRFAPQINVVGPVYGSTSLQGTLRDLSFEDLELEYASSSIAGAGELQHHPDSLSLVLLIKEARLHTEDLQSLLPSHMALGRELGTIRMGGDLRILHTIQGLRANANLALQSNAGGAFGTVSVGRPTNGTWAYTAFLECDAFNLAALTNRATFGSDINGLVSLEGSGITASSAEATVGIDLSHSSIAGRSFDALHVDATLDQDEISGSMHVQRGMGRAQLEGAIAWDSEVPAYAIDIRTHAVDVGPLMLSDSLGIRLTGDWSVAGYGLHPDSLQVKIEARLDTAVVGWGARTMQLPAHAFAAALTSTTAHPLTFRLEGDLVDIMLASNTRLLNRWAASWSAALRGPIERWKANVHTDQEYDTISIVSDSTTGLEGLLAELKLTLKPPLTRAWLAPKGVKATVKVSAEDDRIDFRGAFEADSAAISGIYAADLQSTIAGSATLGGLLEETLTFQVQGGASSWKSGLLRLNSPLLIANGDEGRYTFRLSTPGNHGARIAGTIAGLPHRYRIALDTLSFTVGNYRWSQSVQSAINVFADALRFEQFRLETTDQQNALRQAIQIDGLVAKEGDEAASIVLQSIGLGQLSNYIDGRRSFDGELSARIDWSGLHRPVFQGQMRVADLQLESHILGQLDVRSQYDPASSELALEITLGPVQGSPSPNFLYARNDLSLAGTAQLPGPNDDGALEFELEASRIDAFFLQHLIESVEDVGGGFTGDGSITGTFAYPIFRGDFELANGSLRIPKYDLRYAAEGEVKVVPEGVLMDYVALEDSTGGAASIRGLLKFNDYRFLSLDLVGVLDQLQIMNVSSHTRDLPFFGLIWATGDVTLTGPVHDAFLRSPNLEMAAKSDLFIPLIEHDGKIDPGFIIYADSTGTVPEGRQMRQNILDRRGEDERSFATGLQMDLNIHAPQNSNIHLVIDPLLGDIINSVGSGRVQLQLLEGDLSTFGTFNVDSGDYLFTAGELFVRRFLINEGSILWTGDPLDPLLNISADYRTRASRTGLPQEIGGALQTSLPLIVGLEIAGKLTGVQIELDLSVDQRQEAISDTPLLEAYLNQPDRAAQHATSVLVTNSFLLSADATSNDALAGSAFNSVSNLVSSQLNRYISQVIPNADLTLGILSDESAEDLDVSAAIALHLLDERLVFRGQGVYRGLGNQIESTVQEGLEGEVLLEVHLTPNISFEVFYRREGDVLSETLIINETGAGLSYQAQFTNWRGLIKGILGQNYEASDDDER